MSETLGSLVDKLSIVNVKLYHVQDELFRAHRKGRELDADNTAKLVTLNLERSKLATEIDQLLHDAVSNGEAVVDPRVKIL